MGIEGDNMRYSVKENFTEVVAFELCLKDKSVTCSGTTKKSMLLEHSKQEEWYETESSTHP